MENGKTRGWRAGGLSHRGVAAAALTLLVGIRAVAEFAMMTAHGPDAQMGIWWMFLLVKLAFWLGTGYVACVLLVAWKTSWTRIVAMILGSVWAIAILWASSQYTRGAMALADAANPSTQAERL